MRLYMAMSEMFSEHLRSSRAYPERFELGPDLHAEYLRDVAELAETLGKPVNPAWHMGVTVVVLDGSPGVMIGSDGASTAIR